MRFVLKAGNSPNCCSGRAVRRQARRQMLLERSRRARPAMVVTRHEGLAIGSYFWAAFLAVRVIQALNLKLTSAPHQLSRSFHARRLEMEATTPS
jgi:hypothetical protein